MFHNNAGVSYYESGHLPLASEQFKLAFTSSRQLRRAQRIHHHRRRDLPLSSISIKTSAMSSSTTVEDVMTKPQFETTSNITVSSLFQREEDQDNDPSSTTTGITTTQAFIYDCAIPIVPSMFTDVTTVSSIICFNLALVHQALAGIGKTSSLSTTPLELTSKDRIMLLQKAIKLYQCSFQIERHKSLFLENGNVNVNDSGYRGNNGVSLYFVLALLNNLGVLYKVLNQSTASTIVFQRVLSTLMLVTTTSSRGSTNLERMHDDDSPGMTTTRYEGFFHNALLFCPAATAAANTNGSLRPSSMELKRKRCGCIGSCNTLAPAA